MEIAPILPAAGQIFVWYLENYLDFCAIFQNFLCLFPRFLTEPITTFTGAVFGERGSRGAEKPLLFDRQLHERNRLFYGNRRFITAFSRSGEINLWRPPPQNELCVLMLHLKVTQPIFIPYYKTLHYTVTQNKRQHYIPVYFNFYVYG